MKKLILTAVVLTAFIAAFTGCAATNKAEELVSSNVDSIAVEENEENTEKTEETEMATIESDIVEDNTTEESKETITENKENAKSEETPIADNRIPVTEIIVLDKTVEVGSITPTVLGLLPENADYGIELTFVSDNENVVKVDGIGMVTAVSAGMATVTVTSSNGITTTFKVTVTEKTNY